LFYWLRKRFPEPLREFARRTRARVLSIGLATEGTFEQPEAESVASAKVSVIIPVLDTPQLERFLKSLEKYAPRAEVILVDDGSELKSTRNLLKEYAARNGWDVLQHETPQGHSKATEAGARRATRPYLCLLNTDIVVTPWSWQAAVEAFESDPNVGVTGPSTSHATTPQMLKRAELCRHYWTDTQIFAFAKKCVEIVVGPGRVDLPEAGGFAFFIRRDLWEELEGFDPLLPDYGNEMELCRRVLKKGLRIVWTRKSYIHHLGNQTYSGPRFDSNYIKEKSLRAQEYIVRKHGA
jgi:GT2 family glycosyltransferase